jgi:hypothetical protein
MANDLYSIAREKFLLGQWDWVSDDFGLLLVDNLYVPDFDLDQEVLHIPAPAVAAEGSSFVGDKRANWGYAVGGGVSFTAVIHPLALVAAVMFREGSPRYLVAYIGDAPSLPFFVTDEEFGITVRPPVDTFRWFRL